LDKPHIFALASKIGFLLFKEQVSLKFKNEMSVVQCERKTFPFISLSTPVSFCWTVPIRSTQYGKIFFSIFYLDNSISMCLNYGLMRCQNTNFVLVLHDPPKKNFFLEVPILHAMLLTPTPT
jgi:hypothetical protein